MKTMFKMINTSLIKLPTPSNISSLWNFGFILGMVLIMQILTGLFLSMHYCSNTNEAFNSVMHIIRDVNFGWMFQIIHMNGASLFFIMVFIHIARGIYYSSYKKMMTWFTGFMILILLMLSAFLGYVLPWGQMSFWGATVITNLLSAVPYIGNIMVYWVWGGFSVDLATLSRFFIFHYLFPLIMVFLVILHLFFLHEDGSNNPLGSNSDYDKLPFFIFYFIKDMMLFIFVMLMFLMMVMFFPLVMGDPDNFIHANPMSTPIHIQPEWYFLFAYAILRSIPNKLGGVIALVMSLMILLLMPFFNKKYSSKSFSFWFKLFFWSWITMFIILTFIGMKPVESPFIMIGQIVSVFYFSLIFFL